MVIKLVCLYGDTRKTRSKQNGNFRFHDNKRKNITQQWHCNQIHLAVSLTQSDVHVMAALWCSVAPILKQCIQQSTPVVNS